MDKKNPSREGKNMDTLLERPCTVNESLEQSLAEMKSIRQGKIKKRTWKDLEKELQAEDENDKWSE